MSGMTPTKLEQAIVRVLTVLALAVTILMLMVAMCDTAAAQQGPPMRIIPVWELKECPTETYACYNFEQAKELVRLDLELQMKEAECDACVDNVPYFAAATSRLEEAFQKQRESIDMLTGSLVSKEKQLDDVRVSLQNAEQHTVGHFLPWIVGGVLLASAAAFIGGWVVGAQ